MGFLIETIFKIHIPHDFIFLEEKFIIQLNSLVLGSPPKYCLHYLICSLSLIKMLIRILYLKSLIFIFCFIFSQKYLVDKTLKIIESLLSIILNQNICKLCSTTYTCTVYSTRIIVLSYIYSTYICRIV